jgi:hypothetical protein
MSPELFLGMFLSVDVAFVLGALFYLNRRRAIEDITDMRYKDHPDRAKSKQRFVSRLDTMR